MPDSHPSELQTNAPAKGLARHGSALLEANRLLVLSCPDDDELERQARHLMVWLRHQQPALAVEHLDRLDSDEVVDRMNRLLAQYSLEEATRPPSDGPVQRLWVLHDPQGSRTHDLQLLNRLLQQFPGVRLSALLLTPHAERFDLRDAERPRGLLHCALPGRPRPPEPVAQVPAHTPAPAPAVPAAASSTARVATLARAHRLLAWFGRLRTWRPDGKRLRIVALPVLRRLALSLAQRLARAWATLRQHPWRAKFRLRTAPPAAAVLPPQAPPAEPLPAALALAQRHPLRLHQAPSPAVRTPEAPPVLPTLPAPEAQAVAATPEPAAPARKPRRKSPAAAPPAQGQPAEAVKITPPRAKRAPRAKAKGAPSDKDAGPQP